MNGPQFGVDVVSAQIDRLVTGDLPESERRSLLAWLDEEPSRWRACALAFLEAQTWEQTTALVDFEVHDPAGNALLGVPRNRPSESAVRIDRQRGHRSWLQWLAIAGLVLVAFGTGVWSAWRFMPPSIPSLPLAPTIAAGPQNPIDPLVATVSVHTNLDPRLKAQLTLPVQPLDGPLAESASIPDHIRKQWERRGYEIIEERRFLPAKMPDGQTVMVPISRITLRLKGTPVS